MEIYMPPNKVMTIQQVKDAYMSNDYGAELLLKHLLIRVAELESAFDDQARAFGIALGFLRPDQQKEFQHRAYPDRFPR